MIFKRSFVNLINFFNFFIKLKPIYKLRIYFNLITYINSYFIKKKLNLNITILKLRSFKFLKNSSYFL